MRRIGLLGGILAMSVASFALGAGTRVTIARFTDQETTTASYTTIGCFTNDAAAPTVSASIVAKTTPYIGGFIRQGGSYYVYANISGATTRVTADVRTLTAGQFLVPLTAGSYPLGGVTYGWRSAALTAANPLGAGSVTYSVSPANASNQCRTTNATVTVDNTAPTPTDVQPTRVGGTAGRPDVGDRMVYTFSEQIDPESVLSGWTGASTNVVARITNNGSADTVTIWNSTNTAQLPLGSTNVAGDVVTTDVTFGASGTASTMVQSGATITITFGTQAGTTRTQNGNQFAIWTPSGVPTDRAGNASTTANVTETGAADPQF